LILTWLAELQVPRGFAAIPRRRIPAGRRGRVDAIRLALERLAVIAEAKRARLPRRHRRLDMHPDAPVLLVHVERQSRAVRAHRVDHEARSQIEREPAPGTPPG